MEAPTSRNTYYRQRRNRSWSSREIDNTQGEDYRAETLSTEAVALELSIYQKEDSTTKNLDLPHGTADVGVEQRPSREAACRADRARRALIDSQSL